MKELMIIGAAAGLMLASIAGVYMIGYLRGETAGMRWTAESEVR